MKSVIRVTIIFSFKGKKLSPSVVMDLDALMKTQTLVNGNELLSIYPLLAANINIDTYSYEFEMMQASHPTYSDPSGLAIAYCQAGEFDYSAFCTDWQHHQELQAVEEIAQSYLSINDLEQQPQLKEALLAAFSLGKKSV
jgi:hypothetical protein